mgnify:CR=1 FL=1
MTMMKLKVCVSKLQSWLTATFSASMILFSWNNCMMEFWSMCRCKYISISWAKVEFPVSLISSATILRNLTNSEMAGGIISQKKPTMAANINNKVTAMHSILLWKWSLYWKNFIVGYII